MASITINYTTEDGARVTAATQARFQLAAKPGIIKLVKAFVRDYEQGLAADTARGQAAQAADVDMT